MLIKRTYARFYRSLNFNYILHSGEDGEGRPAWERLPDGRWFPHVVVRLEQSITTIVGANEAGKTQVIDAIRAGLSGERISQSDFCRYSDLFAVDAPISFPEFGIEVGSFTVAEVDTINSLLSLSSTSELITTSTVWIFRTKSVDRPSAGTIFWTDPEDPRKHLRRDVEDLGPWTELIPSVWTIDATIALPNSVPLQWLIDGKSASATSRLERLELVNAILENPTWFDSDASIKEHSAEIANRLTRPSKVDDATLAQYKVARQLLVDVARVDPATFVDLRNAIAKADEGHATAIETAINEQIRRTLNPARWWTQDPDFTLVLGLRDHDLVFTIRDRTGKDYTFGERSTGLKYFLSYLVQFLAGRPRCGTKPKILLMDEPDLYLSSRGQQDLLRVLSAAAHPDDPAFDPTQVVYVTHSPFLIDKNHAERVRVLDKGDLDEGTRVIDTAHHNRYEPLRSSLGPMVGETTFIGSRNIIVEGLSDQILIAGLASDLKKNGVGGHPLPPSRTIDLNDLTIVPAGGTPHVPYVVFLARGRGEEKPPVVVLLDSDPPGKHARQALNTLAFDGKPAIDDCFIVELDSFSWDGRVATSIEDLVPDSIAVRAVDLYHQQLGWPEPHLDPNEIGKRANGLLDQLNSMLQGEHNTPLELHKVAFARCVIDCLPTAPDHEVEELRLAFAPLIGRLAEVSTESAHRERSGAIRKRLNRAIRVFANDFNERSPRDHASKLLATIEALIDVGPNYEALRSEVSKIRALYALNIDLGEPFAQHEKFLGHLRRLPNLLRQDIEPSGETSETRPATAI